MFMLMLMSYALVDFFVLPFVLPYSHGYVATENQLYDMIELCDIIKLYLNYI